MGLLNLLKKTIKQTPSNSNISQDRNSFGESLDKLIDGELPFGWVAHNRDFIEPIEIKRHNLISKWVDTPSPSTTRYDNLKPYVEFLLSTKELCAQKGECFEKWFTDIIASEEYMRKYEKELQDLKAHYSDLAYLEQKKASLLPHLSRDLLAFLQVHDGILQKDVYQNFDSILKPEIQALIYQWDKSGKIKREKSGRTYKLFTNSK